jgi:hypothetical protein
MHKLKSLQHKLNGEQADQRQIKSRIDNQLISIHLFGYNFP